MLRETLVEGRNMLPKYNKSAVCPKCGCMNVYVRWCREQQPVQLCWCNSDVRGDHLHRRCACCGYEWLEACVDSDDSVTA